MGISRSNPIPTAAPVVPGTDVVQSVYTDGGFTAGDYVYRYAENKVGQYPYFGSTLPGVSIYAVIAGTKYALPWGTGATLARSSMTSPISAASTYSVTIPQTTSLGSAYLAQQTINAQTDASYFPKCATLTNGNMVVIYYDNSVSRLKFSIYNPAGTVVNSGTVGSAQPTLTFPTAGTTGEANWQICALNSGGFVIFWFQSGQSYPQFDKYDSSGTFVSTTSTLGSVNSYMYDVCADASDNIYTLTSAGYSGQNLYISKWTSSFVYSTGTVVPFGAQSAYYGTARMVATLSGHIGVAYLYSSSIYYGLLTTSFSTVTSSSSSQNMNGYSGMGVCASLEANGGAFITWPYSSSVYAAYVYATAAGGSSGGTTYTTAASGVSYSSYSATPCVSAYVTTAGVNDGATNGVVFYFCDSATPQIIRTRIANLASDRTTWSLGTTATTPYTTYGAAGYGYSSISACVAAAGANFIVGNGNSGTYYPDLAISGSYTYASTTISTTLSSSYQPTYANGYSLIGVALTTASAGSFGRVAVNGIASLSSSYATSSTPAMFNYNPLNGAGYTGNKGYVVNRVVTLQGLE